MKVFGSWPSSPDLDCLLWGLGAEKRIILCKEKFEKIISGTAYNDYKYLENKNNFNNIYYQVLSLAQRSIDFLCKGSDGHLATT